MQDCDCISYTAYLQAFQKVLLGGLFYAGIGIGEASVCVSSYAAKPFLQT